MDEAQLKSDIGADRRRTRELFRFYQPAYHSRSTIPNNDSYKRRAWLKHDVALTGLAKLSLYQTECKHAFISLFDNQNQYVLAEATKQRSLLSSYGNQDDLVGPCIIDKSVGVSEIALRAFCTEEFTEPVVTDNVSADRTQWVVNDMRKEDNLNAKKFLRVNPNLRFCVEVPIKSPKGYVLGTLCVMDDKPRSSPEKHQLQSLEEISIGIAEHLDFIRAQSSYARAERLVKGLGLFIEGKASVKNWWLNDPENVNASIQMTDQEKRQDLQHRANEEFGMHASDSSTDVIVTDNPTASNVTGTAQAPQSGRLHSPIATKVSDEVNDSYKPIFPGSEEVRQRLEESMEVTSDNASSSVLAIPSGSLTEEIGGAFSRASNLIREAAGLQGAIFFDAFWSRGKGQKSRETAESSSSQSDVDTRNSSHKKSHGRQCDILGYSTRTKSSHLGNKPSSQLPSLTEQTLHRLLRSYPTGTIFTFENDATVTSSEDELYVFGQTKSHESRSEYFDDHQNSVSSRRRRKRDAEMLLKMIPGVRSIAFMPLWDFHRKRWYAGTIAWATDYTRVIGSEELSYFFSFGNSIMAEVSRLDALFSDQAKSDFISSISHEMRSPLHGILGNVELLQSVHKDTPYDEMIRNIEICGRTILDTMDHLLDFAKINKLVKQRSGKALGSESLESKSSNVAFDIGELVEDVVRSIFFGHIYSSSSSALYYGTEGQQASRTDGSYKTRIDASPTVGKGAKSAIKNTMVLVDIEHRDNWVFLSEVGAWKRLLMNLLGNALKYTQSGVICVALRCRKDIVSELSDRYLVTLSINDTGRGMSDDFMKHQLYKPFTQENSLSVGVGLGLSIVQQIASSIGASIELESKVNVGTRIQITSSLESAPSDSYESPLRTFLSDAKSHCESKRVCLYGFDTADFENGNDGLSRVIRKQLSALGPALRNVLSAWLGMDVIFSSSLDGLDCDIVLLHEAQLQKGSAARSNTEDLQNKLKNVPAVVLCSLSSQTTTALSQCVLVTSPFDLRKIAGTVMESLRGVFTRPDSNQGNSSIENLLETRSEPGKATGSDFHSDPNVLPIPTSETFTPQVATPSASSTNSSLLLVDDNPINLRLLSSFMKKLHYKFTTCMNGLEAVKAYHAANPKPGVVFMDISMPVMDGYQASREIRQYENSNGLQRTRIVALTGLGSSDARLEAEANGIDTFLTKPASFKLLKSLLKENDPEQDRKDNDS